MVMGKDAVDVSFEESVAEMASVNLPVTGDAQLTVIIRPLGVKVMPKGTPVMLVDSDVAFASDNVMVPDTALPCAPVMGVTMICGPGATMVTL